MKKISVAAIIEGVRSRKDGSLGLSVTTPELNVQEKALFMELQGINLDLLITPKDGENAPEIKVNTDLKQKSPSTRMRAVLFILWKQDPKDMTFEEFYNNRMEQIIEQLKSRIEE